MCGIAGICAVNGEVPDQQLLNAMADTLRHRGPDDKGIEIYRNVGFAFRRLAILDLSPGGHQPMMTEDRSISIVFNGEIYNFIELRKALEAKGHRFKGHSDTEVILHLYQQEGIKMLSLLNGMFAIAIYDREQDKIFIARDRMGKKPLFYWDSPRLFAFASELRALRLLPGFPDEFDPKALGLYFRIGFIPNWACIYPSVKKLPPASYLEFDVKKHRLYPPRQYWSLPSPYEDSFIRESDWVEHIAELLDDAVRIRLRSDVPLGVFLSGGIDSGLIMASVAKYKSDLTALTIGFPDWEKDETALASETAKHLGLRQIIRNLSVNDASAQLPDIMAHFDEPFIDSSALPTSLICEEARKQFTVILSGDGGDELFAGYHNHLRALQWSWLKRIPNRISNMVKDIFLPFTLPDSQARRFLHRLGYPIGILGMGAMICPFSDWSDKVIRKEYRIDIDSTSEEILSHSDAWQNASPIDQAQRTDMRFFLLDDILVKVDRMSMRHSLEIRSPFLDYRLIETALRIPSHYRVSNGHSKNMLRKLALNRLPKNISESPKRGFGIPLYQWLYESPQSKVFRETFLDRDSDQTNPFITEGLEKLWNNACTNKALLSAVFQVLAYRWWINGSKT